MSKRKILIFVAAVMAVSTLIALNFSMTKQRELFKPDASVGQITTRQTGEREVLTDSPFSPSPAMSLQGGVLRTDSYPPSQVCAGCHTTIHANWKKSLHSQAALDPLYLKVKELLAFEEGENAVKECAACHAPVALMSGEVGLYSKESAASQEGVSCAFCHTLHSTDEESGGWVSDPGRIRPYLGGDYLSPKGIEAAAHLVMAEPQQHREDMMRPLYRTSETCQSCHELTINDVKLQSTYSEWQSSSFAKEGVTCQACHFTPGAGVTQERGRIVDHRPFERERFYRHALNGGALTVSERDNRPELKEALKLEVKRQGTELNVVVRNVKGGHAIPTGVSDLRQLWLEVIALDTNGRVTFSSGVADAAGQLPKEARVFHSVFGDENGQVIQRHDIWRVHKLLKDTRIPADGYRTEKFALPAKVMRVKIRLLWQDIPAEFERSVIQGAVVSAPPVELASWED